VLPFTGLGATAISAGPSPEVYFNGLVISDVSRCSGSFNAVPVL